MEKESVLDETVRYILEGCQDLKWSYRIVNHSILIYTRFKRCRNTSSSVNNYDPSLLAASCMSLSSKYYGSVELDAIIQTFFRILEKKHNINRNAALMKKSLVKMEYIILRMVYFDLNQRSPCQIAKEILRRHGGDYNYEVEESPCLVTKTELNKSKSTMTDPELSTCSDRNFNFGDFVKELQCVTSSQVFQTSCQECKMPDRIKQLAETAAVAAALRYASGSEKNWQAVSEDLLRKLEFEKRKYSEVCGENILLRLEVQQLKEEKEKEFQSMLSDKSEDEKFSSDSSSDYDDTNDPAAKVSGNTLHSNQTQLGKVTAKNSIHLNQNTKKIVPPSKQSSKVAKSETSVKNKTLTKHTSAASIQKLPFHNDVAKKASSNSEAQMLSKDSSNKSGNLVPTVSNFAANFFNDPESVDTIVLEYIKGLHLKHISECAKTSSTDPSFDSEDNPSKSNTSVNSEYEDKMILAKKIPATKSPIKNQISSGTGLAPPLKLNSTNKQQNNSSDSCSKDEDSKFSQCVKMPEPHFKKPTHDLSASEDLELNQAKKVSSSVEFDEEVNQTKKKRSVESDEEATNAGFQSPNK